jgi:SAM-dependent methyltransferase
MPDDRGIVRDVYGCSRCSSLTPDYGVADPLDTLDQITFHERYWQEVDPEGLQTDLANLAGTVASLRRHLGAPATGKRVLEIGAGRGGLLRALRDAGYNAHGCEPAVALVEIARRHYGLGEDSLANIDVDQMLQTSRNGHYSAIFLWHVIEHLTNPMDVLKKASNLLEKNGVIIIQVPLLHSAYLYPEHYFLSSHESFSFIAREIGCALADVIYDEENLFVTAVFRKRSGQSKPLGFLSYATTPDALSQIIILNERSKSAYQKLTEELVEANRQRDTELAAYRDVVNDRDGSLDAWEKLAADRQVALTAMEQLIENGQVAIAEQAQMIEQRNSQAKAFRDVLNDRETSLVAWKKLAQDREVALAAMKKLIDDGVSAVAAQAKMIDQRDLDIAALRKRVEELELGKSDWGSATE